MRNQSRNEFLEEMLDRLGGHLDLPRSTTQEIEGHYKAVQEYLCGDDFFQSRDILIYPQGSMRLGTVNRGLPDEDVDLDFVLQVSGSTHNTEPLKLYDRVWRRLYENERYRPMLIKKKRCIQLTYKSNFHMDILPAISAKDTGQDTRILVPDRDLKDWTFSNPKGYADWFDRESKRIQRRYILEKAGAPTFSGDHEVEELPDPEPHSSKMPLKKSVRLIKRHRDVYFSEKPELKPISIVLTTLATQRYNGSIDVYESMAEIINGIDLWIRERGNNIPVVENPTDKEEEEHERENFADKWRKDPELYFEFRDYIFSLKEWWLSLPELSPSELVKELSDRFGELPVERVHKAYQEAKRKREHLGAPKVVSVNKPPQPWKKA